MRKELSHDAKILLEGADFLEQHDWWPGHNYPAQGSYCAVTAITRGCLDYLSDEHLINSLISFNDSPGRTKDEVVAYMRQLAALV